MNNLNTRQAAIILSLLFVTIFTAFSLQFLGSGIPFGSDNSSHIAEIIYIAKLLKAGETNFWFDQNTLGYPLFLAYQPLPGLFMGGVIAITDKFISPVFLYKLSIALIWSFMPFAWYQGGRWFGMHRLTALILGVLSLSINDWEHFGLGVTSLAFNGLYTQSYGMLLLPLSLGSIYRFLIRNKPDLQGIKQPLLLFFLISTCHVFFGLYTATISLLLIFLHRDQKLQRAKALGFLFFVSALLMAFWLIPFVSNMEYQGGLPWKFERENGFPLKTIFDHLIKGDFFDWGRFPWFSLFLIFGLIINFRHINKPLERWLLLSMGVTIFFFLGRTNFGKFYSFIPLHGELEVIRYMSGIHFCALMINALAISRVFIKMEVWWSGHFKKKWSQKSVIALSGLILISIMAGRVQNILELFPTFDYQKNWFPKLAAYLNKRPPGRFLSHKDYGTDAPFFFNFLPVLADKPQVLSYARGYHDTLSVYYLESFPWLYRLYNIKTVLTLGQQPRGVESGIIKFDRKIDAISAFVATDEFGYFEFIRTPIAIDGDLKKIRENSLKAVRKLYPLRLLPCISNNCGEIKTHIKAHEIREIEFDLATLGEGLDLKRSFGSQVVNEEVSLNSYYSSVNAAGGDERLLLKVSFHPYWHAFVDGHEVKITHIAPNLMAINLTKGKHSVSFRYQNPLYQKILFVLSGISILVWLTLPTIRRRKV